LVVGDLVIYDTVVNVVRKATEQDLIHNINDFLFGWWDGLNIIVSGTKPDLAANSYENLRLVPKEREEENMNLDRYLEI